MLTVFKSNKVQTPFIGYEQLLVIAEKIVQRYVFAGTIPEKDKEDVQMAMVEKFLKKEAVIQKNFKGESKISTYCIAVLNRMCCEIIRSELKHWKNVLSDNEDVGATSFLSASEKFIIKDEVALFARILALFGNEQYKTIVFLACYYKLDPKEYELSKYDENYIDNNLVANLKQPDDSSKGIIFNALSETVNLVEQKQVKPDAVRMWLNKNINILIARLNGPFNRANYNKESLQILFEYYYLNG